MSPSRTSMSRLVYSSEQLFKWSARGTIELCLREKRAIVFMVMKVMIMLKMISWHVLIA